MSIESLAKPFRRLPLFEGLTPLQLTEIVRCASRVIYQPGDILIEEDMEGDAAIVIVSGEAIRTSSGLTGIPAESVGEGVLVGEMAMLIETVHSSTVMARTTMRALKISRADLQEIMMQDPAIADHFVAKISARLSTLAAELRAIDEGLTWAENADAVLPVIAAKSAQASLSLPAFH